MENRRFQFLDMAYSLLSRRRLIGSAAAAGAAVGLLLALLLPAQYTAIARVLPPQSEPSAASLLAGSIGALGGLNGGGGAVGAALGLKNPADIYIGLLKSRSVADRIIANFHLQSVYHQRYLSDTRKLLASRTDLLVEKEGLIAISVTDRDRDRAAALANAYVKGLNTQDAELADTSASQRSRFFQAELGREKSALADAEADLKQTEESSGLVQLNGQAQILIERIAQVRAEIASRGVQLQALAGGETSANPDYQRVQTEQAALQAQLRQLEHGSQSDADAGLATSSAPTIGLTYVRKLREVKYHETLLELLAKQFAAARMDEARSSPQVQIVDAAEPPDRKSGPPRALLTLAFTMLGLLIGCMLAISRDLVAGASEQEHTREQMARIRGLFRRKNRPSHA